MTTEKPTTGKKVNAVQINDLTREVDLKANKKMLHDESETQTHQKISHILNGWHFRGTLQRRRKKKNISNTNSGQCDYRIEIENMHDLNGRKEGEKTVIYRHQRWYDRRYARGK